ncbi:MAG: AAA family ATPase [Pseudomonadota bacterium]
MSNGRHGPSPRLVLITGCSGGGKSTLLEALAAHGHTTIREPGRMIVRQALAEGDDMLLPWKNPVGFAKRALAVARADLEKARRQSGPVIFDRGLLDAALALEHANGTPLEKTLSEDLPYSAPVFLAPPWRMLFENDRERQHGWDEAVLEYERIETALHRLKIGHLRLPKVPVDARVAFILKCLTLAAPRATDA